MHPLGEFLYTLPFFQMLPQEDVQALAQAARAREHRKGQVLFWAEDPADRLLVVLGGWVKLYISTATGDDIVARMATSGDLLGLASIFAEPPRYSLSAQVVERAEVLEIPAMIVREIAAANPVLLHCVMEEMRQRIQTQVEYRQMMWMNAPQRVGWLLLRLSAHMQGKGGSFPFPYDKSVAAAELGMSPETFSRALATLQSATVNCRDSEIHIENFRDLRNYCLITRKGKGKIIIHDQGSLW